MLLLFAIVAPLCAEDGAVVEGQGSVITFWPFFDYRSSPNEGFSNLSILGPLFKYQRHGANRELALRPFFHRNAGVDDTASTYLYPLASGQRWTDGSSFQVLRLFQKRTAPPDGAPASGTMLFPFYISGTTKEHGSYVSLFPFYGDIYGRFWRDEYHYVLFPLYGRTVKGDTETSNYLYPFFSLIRGDNERGFQVWPLYGQAEKDGVYRRRTALWPVYLQEESGLDTATPTSRFYLFPLYTSSVSATRVERHVLWPFFGYVSDRERQVEERDYLWPFVRTSQGGGRTLVSYLPFYSEDRRENSVKRWYLWPLYRHDTLDSELYRRQRNRVLFFLYSDDTETWPLDDRQRRRVALWPVFTYRQDARGVSTFTFPAPVEPIFNREGIEKSWAPLWRLYIQKWNEQGDSAVSFLWNLYWHERRQDDLAYELFPFIAYKAEQQRTDVKVLKGLVHYRRGNDGSRLSFFWLPFAVHWRNAPVAEGSAGSAVKGEGH
jgi:hypothetical protein